MWVFLIVLVARGLVGLSSSDTTYITWNSRCRWHGAALGARGQRGCLGGQVPLPQTVTVPEQTLEDCPYKQVVFPLQLQYLGV